MLETWDYEGNVEKAREAGLISGNGVIDSWRSGLYSHMGSEGFGSANCRELDIMAAELLVLFADLEGSFVELGGGAGRGLMDAYMLGKRIGVRRKLVNVGAVPIDPYTLLKFRTARSPDYQLVSNCGRKFLSLLGLKFPVEDVLRMQTRLEISLIEEAEEPFIDEQRIGFFPNEVDIDGMKGEALMVYDKWGAFTYSMIESDGTVLGAFEKANYLLAKHGVFVMPRPVGSENYPPLFEQLCEEGDLVLWNDAYIVWLKSESPLLAGIKRLLPDLGDKRLARVWRLDALFKEAMKGEGEFVEGRDFGLGGISFV